LRALTELQRAGIGVPEHVSVTGFDDLVWSSVVTPGLTTVRMNMAEIADIAIAALVRVIEADTGLDVARTVTGTVAADRSSVPMQLVVRQTSAPPPKAPIA
jgi:LacI family transcriptional regulator